MSMNVIRVPGQDAVASHLFADLDLHSISGEARRAALVARFAAGLALAIRSRRLHHKPPPGASQRLLRGAPPPSRRPVNVGSVRHLQKGTTPVLSVIRRRALATVADCGISMWLP